MKIVFEIYHLTCPCGRRYVMLGLRSQKAADSTDRFEGAKHLKKILLGGVAAFSIAVLTLPSHAADLMDGPSSFAWTGFYVGAHVGGGFIEARDLSNPGGGIESDGIIGGGLVGYNIQAGELVVGLEADISIGDFDGGNLGGGGFISSVSPDVMGTIRGRMGLALDRFLVYGTGGLLFADMDVGHTDPVTTLNSDYHSFVLGGGVEWAVTDTINVRAEYLYSDLGTRTLTFGPFDSHTVAVDDLHIIRTAAIWRF